MVDRITLKFAFLNVECKDDKSCLQRDPHSLCLPLGDYSKCACKVNYLLEITNTTEKCIREPPNFVEPREEYKEGLTAAPIILCFMGCVVVEAVCLLAFHYWKKHRRTEFISHGTCHPQAVPLAVPLADVQFHIQERAPVISFTITPEMESSISDSRTSSPPPYSQTAIVSSSNAAQSEEPPPSYEEAIRQCPNSSENCSADKSNQRKLSC